MFTGQIGGPDSQFGAIQFGSLGEATFLELAADLVIDLAFLADLSGPALLELAADLVIDLAFDPGLIQTQRLAADLAIDLALDAPVRMLQILTADLVVDLALDPGVIQIQRVRADLVVALAISDGYVGPGTGVVVGDQTLTLESLRKGDAFVLVEPSAGGSGQVGLARVTEIAFDELGRPSWTIEFHPFTDGATVLEISAAGRLQYVLRQRGDLVQQVIKQGHDVAALDRPKPT